MSKRVDIIQMRIIMEMSKNMSDCSRAKHGALIADKDSEISMGRVWATGVNQHHTPHNCVRVDSEHATNDYKGCPAIHAEQDMFAWLVKRPDPHFTIEDCVMYVTGIPCPSCAKLIVACNVNELVLLVYNRELSITERETLSMLNKNVGQVRLLTENEMKTLNMSSNMW